MKKLFKTVAAFALALAAAGMLSGCMEKSIVVPHSDTPDLTIKDDVTIDWDQVMAECEETLNADDYPDGSYLDFAVHEEEKTVELIWPIKNKTSQLEALEYGKAYIRAFNDAVATQDNKYAFSTDDYYGGFWDEYTIDLQVFWDTDYIILHPEEYLVNQIIDPGANDPVLPQVMASMTKESTEGESDTAASEETTEAEEKETSKASEETSEAEESTETAEETSKAASEE